MSDAASPEECPAGPAPCEPAVSPLTAWTGFLVRQIYLRSRAHFTAALAPLGLRPQDFSVLNVVAQAPLSQVALAAKLGVDRTTMVKLLDDLEGLGLVSRQRNAQDRRAHDVTLTPVGETTLAASRTQATAADRLFFAPLTAAELEQFRSMLLRLITAYDGTVGMAPAPVPAQEAGDLEEASSLLAHG